MSIIGVVTAKTCSHCGHHEIGIVTEDGRFLPLRPGMWVELFDRHPRMQLDSRQKEPQVLEQPHQYPNSSPLVAWAPEPLLASKELCLKYGVLLDADKAQVPMTPQLYKLAYLNKLHNLIEKETSIPLPVLLDQYFTAPHLASGDTKDVIEAMWEDLEEIRRPVELISEWLADPNPENLKKLIFPRTPEELQQKGVSPSPEQLREALTQLSLEEFFQILLQRA